MNCPLCGLEFKANRGPCRSCPSLISCHLVRCPRCGYAMPAEPGIVKVVKEWRQKWSLKRGLRKP